MRQIRFWGLYLFLLLIVSLPAQASEDYWGRNLSIPTKVQRIVSLSPATTEMVYAINAQDVLVGVTNDCNYPLAASKKRHVGRFGQIQLEKILKLKPDLILVTADMGKALVPLRQLSVPILAFETPDVEAIYRNMQTLGQVTNRKTEAAQQVVKMQKSIASIQSKIIHPSVVYLISEQPLIVATPSSFIGDALKISGAQNIVPLKSAPFIHYSLETLLKQNPDVLILPKSMSKRLELKRPPFNHLTAVQKNRVLFVDDDILQRPGPRVVDAIQIINSYLRTLRL